LVSPSVQPRLSGKQSQSLRLQLSRSNIQLSATISSRTVCSKLAKSTVSLVVPILSTVNNYSCLLSKQTIIGYSPLGGGFLTGKIKSNKDFEDGDMRKDWDRFSDENMPHNLKLVEKLNSIAEKKSITTSQLAVAWVLHQADNIIPLPGSVSLILLLFFVKTCVDLSISLADRLARKESRSRWKLPTSSSQKVSLYF